MAEQQLQVAGYDPYNPFPYTDYDPSQYLCVESSFMAADPEAYISNNHLMELRERAIIVILKYSKCENFDPTIPYLAMNYVDRFLSRERVPEVVGATPQHDLELLALCCLTLAWQLRNNNFDVTELQDAQPDLIFVASWQLKAVRNHIIEKLKSCMHAVTPLCYLPHFEPLMDPTCALHRKPISELIIQSIQDPQFTKYKPSLIAASTIAAASSKLYPERDHHNFFLLLVESEILQSEDHPAFMEVAELVGKLIPETGLTESRQEKTEGEPSNAGSSSERPADHNGKEEALETVQKMAEDSQGRRLDFPLKWGRRVANAENFVLFKNFQLRPAQEQLDSDLLPEQEVVPDHSVQGDPEPDKVVPHT
ncbi:Cyclin [Parasponia andersonii]|uniref:B-like cyclin n=1 Tax=Parasponia andersonii TaxID=3476 RepID=A0A2P5AP77_PARAD|nr:Cyclin [Parasponia andersonii]